MLRNGRGWAAGHKKRDSGPVRSMGGSRRQWLLRPLQAASLLLALLFFASLWRPRAESIIESTHTLKAGLLYTDYSSSLHPIDYLIRKARQEWATTLRSQSKTLRAASKEYRRRYGRKPPRGFDLWYRFAKANNVQLIDEYDQINDDLAPFYGMSPAMYRKSAFDATQDISTWTWVIRDGELQSSAPSADFIKTKSHHHHKATEVEKYYLQPFLAMMKDVRLSLNLTMNMDDGPRQKPTHRLRSRLLAHSRADIEPNDLTLVLRQEDRHDPIFAIACPTTSLAHQHEMKRFREHLTVYDREFQPQPGAFVDDPSLAMNPCDHPDLLGFHVTTMFSVGAWAHLQPMVSQAKDSIAGDIVFPYTYEFEVDVGDDPAWEDKPHRKLGWRGSATGQTLVERRKLDLSLRSQRVRLVNKLHEKSGETRLIIAQADGTLGTQTADIATLNERLTDTAITRILQCNPVELCELLGNLTYVDTRQQPKEELNKYRYLLDIDGNSFSGRFRRLMLSNSTVIKAVTTPEWYTKRMKAWVHYVPILNSYEDLYNIMTYFEGIPNKADSGHQQTAKEIAMAGKEWTQRTWTMPDMQAYALRILLEIARLSSDDRDAMSMN